DQKPLSPEARTQEGVPADSTYARTCYATQPTRLSTTCSAVRDGGGRQLHLHAQRPHGRRDAAERYPARLARSAHPVRRAMTAAVARPAVGTTAAAEAPAARVFVASQRQLMWWKFRRHR